MISTQESAEHVLLTRMLGIGWLDPFTYVFLRLVRSPMVFGFLIFLGGILLFVWNSLSGTLSSKLPGAPICGPRFFGYLENVSWSVSMISLLPAAGGLTIRYYRTLAVFITHLFSGENEESKSSDLIIAFMDRARPRFIFGSSLSYWLRGVLIISGVIILWANGYYFYGYAKDARAACSWMMKPHSLTEVTPLNFFWYLSGAGRVAAVIQTVLIWVFVLFAFRGLLVAQCLNSLFADRQYTYPVTIHPLQPDGVCGLSAIRDRILLLNNILFLIGLYISLKIVDRLIFLRGSLFDDIGIPAFFLFYIIMGPVLFFYSLYAPHDRMKVAKEEFLQPIGDTMENCLQLISVASPTNAKGQVEMLTKLKGMRDEWIKQIPVWPLDLRSIRSFVQGIVLPILPSIIAVIIQWALR